MAAFWKGRLFICTEAGGVLQHLAISVLTMSLDRATVTVGQPFHLKIHAHIHQRISRLDNLTLPDLVAFTELSDERHLTPGRHAGTEYNETLTLQANDAGTISIPPVSIDAFNTQDPEQRPSRFSSTESLVVHVLPRTRAPSDLLPSRWWWEMLLAGVAGVGALILAGWLALRTLRHFRKPSPAELSESAPAPTRSYELGQLAPAQRLRQAVTLLERAPSIAQAEEVRLALRAIVGAQEAETLEDVLNRIPEPGRATWEQALRAAERAVFIEVSQRPAAILEALPYFERACTLLEE